MKKLPGNEIVLKIKRHDNAEVEVCVFVEATSSCQTNIFLFFHRIFPYIYINVTSCIRAEYCQLFNNQS